MSSMYILPSPFSLGQDLGRCVPAYSLYTPNNAGACEKPEKAVIKGWNE